MPTPLTDADKVLRNDTGKAIVEKLDTIATAISESTPDELSELNDVNISSPTSNQALVYNPETGKWENGEVSTVGSIDDLDDVDTTGKAEGDSLRYNGTEWVAQPTTVKLTLAEYNALTEKAPNTRYILTDAPALEYTAEDLSYDGGTDTVWDKVEAVDSGALRIATFDFTKAVNTTTQVLYYVLRTDINLPTGAKVKSCFLRENVYNSVNAGGLIYSARVNESASNAIEGAIYNGTNANRTYQITATVFYTMT